MAPSAALAPAADVAKVFLSYSRKDVSLADDMVAGPQAYGFEADIDREDIAPGEAREARLSGLIAERDTVVYVISRLGLFVAMPPGSDRDTAAVEAIAPGRVGAGA